MPYFLTTNSVAVMMERRMTERLPRVFDRYVLLAKFKALPWHLSGEIKEKPRKPHSV